MAQNTADTPAPGPNDGNFPGFTYLERVTAAASRAVIAHTKELNGAWTEMREGRYSATAALQLWARVAENYFGVVTEAWRAPGAVRTPAWLGIPFSKGTSQPFYSVAIDEMLENAASFEVTRFALIEAHSAEEGVELAAITNGVDGVLAGPPTARGTRIEIELEPKVVKYLPNGTYLGFIFRGGAGPDRPLVVVVLRVMD